MEVGNFKNSYRIDYSFFIRHPALPINFSYENKINLKKYILETQPSLFNAIKSTTIDLLNISSKKNIQKEKLTLLKYLKRAYSNSIPFDLFAGIGIGNWNDIKQFDIAFNIIESKYNFSSNINLEYCHFNPTIELYKDFLVYYKFISGLSKVEYIKIEATSELIKMITLFSNSIKLKTDNLYNLDCFKKYNKETIKSYIEELFNEQILISNTKPSLNTNSNTFSYHFNGEIISRNMIKNTISSLPKEVKKDISKVMDVYNRLTVYNVNEDMKTFIDNFKDRYGEHETPLLEALNIETGIGYSNFLTEHEHIHFFDFIESKEKNKGSFTANNKIDIFFIKKIIETYNKNEIVINKNEIKELPVNWKGFSNTFSVLFSILSYNDHGKNTYSIDGIGGASSIDLFSRFSKNSTQIKEYCQEIINKECNNKDIIYCFIDFYDDYKSIEISKNDLEVNYFTVINSGYENSSSMYIPLSDFILFYNYKDGELQMKSKKLNKRIIPRFYSSFSPSENFHILKFLYDMQVNTQEKNYCKINLRHLLEIFGKTPRIRFENFILNPAEWQLSKEHFFDLNKEYNIECVNRWCIKHKLPKKFLICSDEDSELLINLNVKIDYELFYSLFDKQKIILIREFIFSESEPLIKNSNNEIYLNQIIATVSKI